MDPVKTEVLPVSPVAPEAERIARAAEVLRSGGLVAFPTETVYGLGANALNTAAVARIFAAKGRPANNPLIVHVAAKEQVLQVAAAWPRAAELLAARFWPGPLTLVLPKHPRLPEVVTAYARTVAVRVPAHRVALELLRAADVPIAAPSANRSEGVSATQAEHVLHALQGRIDLVLDGGPTPGGLESTVLDITCKPPRLLRPGLVSVAEIEREIGQIEVHRVAATSAEAALPSPGLSRRHYAPRAPLECVQGDALPRVEQWLEQGVRVGWLVLGCARTSPTGAIVVEMPPNPIAYAVRLYTELHAFDRANVERILVELPPDTREWLAVRDRLLRAATTE